jgi:hypothetical protein
MIAFNSCRENPGDNLRGINLAHHDFSRSAVFYNRITWYFRNAVFAILKRISFFVSGVKTAECPDQIVFVVSGHILTATREEGHTGMEVVHGLIVIGLLAFCVLSTGCISEDTPAPGAGGGILQEGVLLQPIGDVTGQGIILQGVPRGTIDTITVTIGLAPGVQTLDLDNLTIVYADAVRTELFIAVEGYRGNPPPGYWGIIAVVNELGFPNMRMDFEEQFVIQINPKAPVVPNQVVTISLKPVDSRPLVLRRIAPVAIYEKDNILPVL